MRYLTLLGLIAVGCSAENNSSHQAIDVAGDWTADTLLNISKATVGKEKTKLGDLSLGGAKANEGSDRDEGSAVFTAMAYAPQGSLQEPLLDDEGEILYEPLGSIVYRGIWKAPTYEGATSLDLYLTCESVQLTANRPDLQAVCGDPFSASVSDSCSYPEGSTTIICTDGEPDKVWSRVE